MPLFGSGPEFPSLDQSIGFTQVPNKIPKHIYHVHVNQAEHINNGSYKLINKVGEEIKMAIGFHKVKK